VITLRRSRDRGRGDYGWLKARYSFAFANYHDFDHMGFRALRVLNEDRIAGGGAFPVHPHRDMEILTYVIAGGLEHRDSMGNGSLISAGEFQLMSAGTGIRHSETNVSATDPLHLLQIWLHPDAQGFEPSYQQRSFDGRENALVRVVSSDGIQGALRIHQDLEIYSCLLETGESIQHELAPNRHAWIQLVRGRLRVNGEVLEAGDGAALSEEPVVELHAEKSADLLLFDLA